MTCSVYTQDVERIIATHNGEQMNGKRGKRKRKKQMKTPEEMAEEWGNAQPLISFDDQDREQVQAAYECNRQRHAKSFLAGYKAAQGNSTNNSDSLNQTNLPTPAKWISVKDRLPELGLECVWWSGCDYCVETRCYDDIVDWEYGYTHWMPLPEPPEKEK